MKPCTGTGRNGPRPPFPLRAALMLTITASCTGFAVRHEATAGSRGRRSRSAPMTRTSSFTGTGSAGGSDVSSHVPAQLGGRLAVGDAELGQHGRDVVIDCLWRDEQRAGDLGVGLSFADQLEHFAFTRSEPERMRP